MRRVYRLSVVLWLDKGDFPEHLHTVYHLCIGRNRESILSLWSKRRTKSNVSPHRKKQGAAHSEPLIQTADRSAQCQKMVKTDRSHVDRLTVPWRVQSTARHSGGRDFTLCFPCILEIRQSWSMVTLSVGLGFILSLAFDFRFVVFIGAVSQWWSSEPRLAGVTDFLLLLTCLFKVFSHE